MSAHPAKFSDSIVAQLRDLLLARYPDFWGRPQIHDPFAGTGEQLARIAGDEFNYSGTEIEAPFIINDRVRHGDATDPETYPSCPFVIVTSPVYSNGIADAWVASDGSKRYTYRQALVEITGNPDYEMAPTNMGQFGYRGTKRIEDGGTSKKREMYWGLAERAVQCWGRAEMLFVNVSDFMHSREVIEPLVDDWKVLLGAYGWVIEDEVRVRTPRNKNGANRDLRVDSEVILVAVR